MRLLVLSLLLAGCTPAQNLTTVCYQPTTCTVVEYVPANDYAIDQILARFK